MSDTQSHEEAHREAAQARLFMPRIHREKRQRKREGNANPQKGSGKEEMVSTVDSEDAAPDPHGDSLIDRTTLCLPSFTGELVVHAGDDGFKDVLGRYFPVAENNATERLVDLKRRLKSAPRQVFWTMLLREMCEITGSQCGFVAKRMLVDDTNSAVEMPELGEPGSCLMGVGFYINNGKDVDEMHHDYRWHAFGTPCAHMKHDKVFIVPERLEEVVPNNPNQMPWERSEAFIGVPLFADDKCFAHFGLIWSSEGAEQRKLGWAYIEMFMHSLEDMIVQQLLEGNGLAKDAMTSETPSAKMIPLSAITASQTLKPYARSLSHELRTPMQGIVGMLDIMYSTVLDAIANQPNDIVRSVFQDLKNHIELVQDSSKRAVEAADNVVHAYDMNLQMPEIPLTPEEIDQGRALPRRESQFLKPISATGFGTLSSASLKRARSSVDYFHGCPPTKRIPATKEADVFRIYCSDETATCTTALLSKLNAASDTDERDDSRPRTPTPSSNLPDSLHRRVVIRDFLRSLLSDTVRRVHPIKEVHTETKLGEMIEVTTIGSRDEMQERTLYLEVEANVPEVVVTEQQHLQFSLQKIIDNAIKFTESGNIFVKVRLGDLDEKIEVWVVDTGCGIDEESKQNLFKPHFQQDSSISRARDGLGLSLFNAKAQIRKNLGGDVTLERSATEGPTKGSEFLIQLPMSTMVSENDAPIVGTPPISSYHASHAPFWSNPNISPARQESISVSHPLVMEPEPKSPKLVTRKRPAFNPKLAKDYPLNILIAEDNAINRGVAIGSLTKLGYSSANIKVAFDGLEAVKHYKSSLTQPPEARINAVLMDIWMPNMDGYEATRNIKELAETAGVGGITVIAVTADITNESVERAKAAGMEGFLAKPYKVLDIERLIVEHFTKRIEGEL